MTKIVDGHEHSDRSVPSLRRTYGGRTSFEIGSIDWRCVSCGERVDPVILAHRQHQTSRQVKPKRYLPVQAEPA